MNNQLQLREVAERFQKSEETVKRWIRSGKFPNAYKKTDKQGWQIPQQDLQALLTSSSKPSKSENQTKNNELFSPPQKEYERISVISISSSYDDFTY